MDGGTAGCEAQAEVVVRGAGEADRAVLERLWQLFRHDLAPYQGGFPPGPGGTYGTERLDAAFGNPDRALYLFLSGPSPVGFALVRGLAEGAGVSGSEDVALSERAAGAEGVAVSGSEDVARSEVMSGSERAAGAEGVAVSGSEDVARSEGVAGTGAVMSAFFVVRGLRRGGVGLRAVREVLADRPGRWEIPFQEANTAAARFWRRLAESVAPGEWTEEPRGVPVRPEAPPDRWITFRTDPRGPAGSGTRT